MGRPSAAAWAAAACLALAGPAPAAEPRFTAVTGAPVALGLHPEAEGFSQPVFLTEAPDGSGRRFVVEQAGRVRLLTPGAAHHPVYLDLRPVVASGGERGLLGLAFHPRFAENGHLYVYFTDRRGDIVLARLTVNPQGPGPVEPGTLKPVLVIDNPAPNHNGGMIAFGPDGHLYVGTGDGGGAGDPFQNGQNTYSHLGKVLRIDVDHPANGRPYGIPPDNPFLGLSNHRPEIWALGLRNPWRFSFDPATGDLFIADVGQDDWEEVNREPAGGSGGVNYGWGRMEGRHCFPPKGHKAKCETGTLPVVEYGHQFGCSVTGGYVYRGREVPKLDGVYLFADYCSGIVWGLFPRDGGKYSMRRLLETDLSISSFGRDAAGELYLLDHRGGGVWRVVPKGWKPPPPPVVEPEPEPEPTPPPPKSVLEAAPVLPDGD